MSAASTNTAPEPGPRLVDQLTDHARRNVASRATDTAELREFGLALGLFAVDPDCEDADNLITASPFDTAAPADPSTRVDQPDAHRHVRRIYVV